MQSERPALSPRALAYGIGASGLLAVVLGTFLPWLRSGEVQRNSYASFGTLGRLVGFHGPSEVALRVWPLLGLCCAAVVLTVVATWHRTAATLALVVAGWSAAVGCAVLIRHDDSGVSVVALGPIVTVAGDAAVVLAAILVLVSSSRRPSTQRSRS
jgi:hypothetical protein